jgi:hypothetical protein
MARRRFRGEEIFAFQHEVARGARPSDVARSHGFAASNFRRWFARYGRPHFPYEPSQTDRDRARTWRAARTLTEAWNLYRAFAREDPWADDAELPILHDDHEAQNADESLTLHALSDPRLLVVCEKKSIEELLGNGSGPGRPSMALVQRYALAWYPQLASSWTARVLGSHAKAHGVSLAFVGDLDPQSLHAFAALRAGGRKALLRGGRPRVPLRWAGLDSRWLDWISRAQPSGEVPSWLTIRLRWLDQEYWELVKRLVPDVRALIGKRAYELLDGGAKIEVEAPQNLRNVSYTEELARRLRVGAR